MGDILLLIMLLFFFYRIYDLYRDGCTDLSLLCFHRGDFSLYRYQSLCFVKKGQPKLNTHWSGKVLFLVAALLSLPVAVFVILRMTTIPAAGDRGRSWIFSISETSDSTSEQLMTMFSAVVLSFCSIPVIFIHVCHDPLLESIYCFSFN